MSTPEQRNLWRQRATWLTQLGLGPDDPAPTAVVEEVSHAVLALLNELQRVEHARDTTIQSSTVSRAPSDTVARMTEYYDHDHRAEAAFLDYVAAPTPDNAHAAELTIATLQRRHDALVHDADEARRYARLLYQQVTIGVLDYGALDVPMDTSEWPTWLTYYDGEDPARQDPAP